ncbi:MAG TPA: aspartyl/glutamyl-tRNA amidotransferase subunit C [Bacilli bacterium]|nr:aspartyl/glutamyl-tRNA amidotransferase subunit C [Bacilli bacterium]
MKEITIDVLKDAAQRLMFDMSDEQYAKLFDEFKIITRQMDLIGHIDGVDDAQPMTFPFASETDFMREDVPTEPLPVKEVLRNASEVLDNQIKLPKVVG